MKKLQLLAILGLAFLSAVGQAKPVKIEIANAWAKAPGPNGAIFMDIINHTLKNDKLKRATSNVAKKVELHTHIKEGDIYRMRRIKSMAIAASATTSLQSGGLHIMLIGLKQPLKPGDRIPLKLKFARAGEITISVEVKSVVPNPASDECQCPRKKAK